MPKLAVFDLDGTLLNDNHDISDRNMESLQKLRERGCRIVIATGRTDLLVKEYVKKLGMDTPVISCNGATIRNPFTHEEIFKKVLSRDKVREIIDICNRDNHVYLVYSKECIITIPNERVDQLKKRNESLDEECRVEFVFNRDGNDIANKYEVYKVLIIEKDREKFAGLKEKFKHLDDVTLCQSNNGYMDIMAKGTSKKNALNILAQFDDISPEDIVAFGDNYNDIEMLQFAGRAITTENGVQAVKEIAHYISKHNNEDGVAHAIEDYLKII